MATPGFLTPNPSVTRRRWGWLLALGLLLIAIGAMASATAVFTTIVTMVFFGWLLLFTGISQIISAFRHRNPDNFWLHLLSAILDATVGLLLIIRPGAGAAAFTLVLAAYFFVGGIFRGAAATSLKLPGRGWAILSALVDIILASLLVAGWPESGLWVIGLFVGINFIIQGAVWVAFALAARRTVRAFPEAKPVPALRRPKGPSDGGLANQSCAAKFTKRWTRSEKPR